MYREKLEGLQRKGLVQLVFYHVLEGFKDKLRRNHDWLGVLLPPLDTQVRVFVVGWWTQAAACCVPHLVFSLRFLSLWLPAYGPMAPPVVGAAHIQLLITRPQRIATFAGVMLTSMAINAFFFGKGALLDLSHVLGSVCFNRRGFWACEPPREVSCVTIACITCYFWFSYLFCSPDPNNVGDRILAGFISSLFLAPVQKLFPFLFKAINTFRSYTLTRMEQLKKQALKKRKAQHKEASRIALGRSASFWSRLCTLLFLTFFG
jgi:hypothetical protein